MPTYTPDACDTYYQLVAKLNAFLVSNGGGYDSDAQDSVNNLWRKVYRNYSSLAGVTPVVFPASDYELLRRVVSAAQQNLGGTGPDSSDNFIDLLRKLVVLHGGTCTLYDTISDLIKKLLSLPFPIGAEVLDMTGTAVTDMTGETITRI